jgi:hypothetical protein
MIFLEIRQFADLFVTLCAFRLPLCDFVHDEIIKYPVNSLINWTKCLSLQNVK